MTAITFAEQDAEAEIDAMVAAGHDLRDIAVQMAVQVILLAEHRDALTRDLTALADACEWETAEVSHIGASRLSVRDVTDWRTFDRTLRLYANGSTRDGAP